MSERGGSSRARTLDEDFSPEQIRQLQALNNKSTKRWPYGDSSPLSVALRAGALRQRSSYDPDALDTAEFANRFRGGASTNASGMYAKVARADKYRRSVRKAVDLYRIRAGSTAPGSNARAYEESPSPSITVAGKEFVDPQAAMAHATAVGDAYQRRRDLFAHLKSAGFSADQLKSLRGSRNLQNDVRALYGSRYDALKKAYDAATAGFIKTGEALKNMEGKGLKSKGAVLRDALKDRISLGSGGLELLPKGQGDSRFSYIAKALEQAGLIGAASASVSRGASSGRYSARSGASGGAAEYNSHVSRDVSTGTVKGTERGWTRATSSSGWIGGSDGAGGSPAGQAGSAVRRLLSEVFGAYPGGEFRGELANGKLDFTEDTRGQGMGLRAGFHSSRESKVNNALVDFNNWASKQYGDYLVSARGRADRAVQQQLDRTYALTKALHATEMKNINDQLSSMVWLARNGYGAPNVQEPEAKQGGITTDQTKASRDAALLDGTGVEDVTGLQDMDEQPV